MEAQHTAVYTSGHCMLYGAGAEGVLMILSSKASKSYAGLPAGGALSDVDMGNNERFSYDK